MTSFRIFFCALVIVLPCWAKEKRPLPRFAAIKADVVNVRVGPGCQYPIDWIFQRAGLPVEVIAEFDTWLQVKDMDGATGWIQRTMVRSFRNAILKTVTFLYDDNTETAKPIAQLDKGVIVAVLQCKPGWCKVRIKNSKGWVKRPTLWGIYPDESF